VVNDAWDAISAAVRVASALDQAGRQPKVPVVSEADRRRFGAWFAVFADRVITVPGGGASSPDLVGHGIALLKWLGSVSVKVLKENKYVTDRATEFFKTGLSRLVTSADWFETWRGVEVGGPQSVVRRILVRTDACFIEDLSYLDGVIERRSTVLGRSLSDRVPSFKEWHTLQTLGTRLDAERPRLRMNALIVACGVLTFVKLWRDYLKKGPDAPPSGDWVPTWVRDTRDYASLMNDLFRAGFRKRAAVALEELASLAEVGGAKHVEYFRLYDARFRMAGNALAGAAALFDLVSAMQEASKGNTARSAVYGLQAVVLFAMAISSPPLWVWVLTVTVFTLLLEVLRRSEAEDRYAAVLAETEFGAAGAKRQGLVREYIPDEDEADEAFLRNGGPDPERDAQAIAELYLQASCRAQPGRVVREGLQPYPVACIWISPRPQQKQLPVALEVTGIPGLPPRLDVRVDCVAVEPDGSVRLRTWIAEAGHPGPVQQVAQRRHFDWMADPPPGPFVLRAKDSGGELVLYVATPLNDDINYSLGEVIIPPGKRLLFLLGPHDVDLMRWQAYEPLGPVPQPAVKLHFPLIGLDGQPHHVEGWQLPSEAVLTPTFIGGEIVFAVSAR
jgi:hypothetical protein